MDTRDLVYSILFGIIIIIWVLYMFKDVLRVADSARERGLPVRYVIPGIVKSVFINMLIGFCVLEIFKLAGYDPFYYFRLFMEDVQQITVNFATGF